MTAGSSKISSKTSGTTKLSVKRPPAGVFHFLGRRRTPGGPVSFSALRRKFTCFTVCFSTGGCEKIELRRAAFFFHPVSHFSLPIFSTRIPPSPIPHFSHIRFTVLICRDFRGFWGAVRSRPHFHTPYYYYYLISFIILFYLCCPANRLEARWRNFFIQRVLLL